MSRSFKPLKNIKGPGEITSKETHYVDGIRVSLMGMKMDDETRPRSKFNSLFTFVKNYLMQYKLAKKGK